MTRKPYPGCPAEDLLQDIAAGIASTETVVQSTPHIAGCDYCGPLLRKYIHEFSDELTTEDTAILKKLESSKPEWQKAFVRKHVVFEQQDKKSEWEKVKAFFSWPKLVGFAASAAVVVVAVLVLVQRRSDDPDKLVAAAFAERRTTEMRLTGVPYSKYASYGKQLGGEHISDFDRPKLAQAKSRVLEKVYSGKASPEWLAAEGEVALLEGSDSTVALAEDTLKKARTTVDTPRLQIDMAAAYFEQDIRHAREGTFPVLARTIDLLNSVLKNSKLTSEDREAALFDLSIAYEKSEMLDLALTTWEQYLQLDSSSEWASEARQHINELKKKVPTPKPQAYKQPSYFLAHRFDPAIQGELEDYQQIALTEWLPEAVRNPSGDPAKAIHLLAALFEEKHADPWLKDFFGSLNSSDPDAVKALGEAITYNFNDLHHQAMGQSRAAAEKFGKSRNIAGEVRSSFEEIYGLQRIRLGGQCLQKIEHLWPRLVSTRYRWLQAQVALEKATCANLVLDFDRSDESIKNSRILAAGFPELTVRIQGLDAGIKKLQGNCDAVWQEGVGGLRDYWDRPLSWERLYQFYSVLWQCASKSMNLPHAAEALIMHGGSILENNAPGDVTLRAMLYLREAKLLAGNDEIAEEKVRRAEQLLKGTAAAGPINQLYAAQIRIELAEFELQHGRAEVALSKIGPLGQLLINQDEFIKLDYYRVLGEIYRKLHRTEDAVSSFRTGIELAERAISNLQDDSARLEWIASTEPVYRDLSRALLDEKHGDEALQVWERLESRSLLKHAAGAGQQPAAENVYPALPVTPDTRIVYAVFEDGIQIWTVNPTKSDGKWISVAENDLLREVQEFARECSMPGKSLDKSQQMYSFFLSPVASSLPQSGTVVIELDHVIPVLPLEAIITPDGSYFGEKYSVVYSPGLLAETTLRAPEAFQKQDSMLLVDGSLALDGISPPGHAEEVKGITEVFQDTKILGPSGITQAHVRKALPLQHALHFSGHAKRDGDGAALMLTPELSIRAGDFSPQMTTRLQMAVLSACSTGFNQHGMLDSDNLVRSLLADGVPTVIASHWDVDSRSTAQLMRSFYSHYGRGEPAAEALKNARQSVLAANPHPYYWAAFTLSGKSR